MVVVTHQAEKIWTYDRVTVQPTVQGATFNMCGQLYHRHANAMALSSSPVVSALGSESELQAPLLGLAKSIYYHRQHMDPRYPLPTSRELVREVKIKLRGSLDITIRQVSRFTLLANDKF